MYLLFKENICVVNEKEVMMVKRLEHLIL